MRSGLILPCLAAAVVFYLSAPVLVQQIMSEIEKVK
jgi:hypothetical protein